MKNILDTKNYAILTDVDMSLVPSMSTVLTPARQAIASYLHTSLKGGFALVTGRPARSVDATFPGQLPASVEHHSAWRPEQNGKFIPLASPIDAEAMADYVHTKIDGNLPIFADQRQVLGKESGVFIEKKNYALALVFAAQATPEEGKTFLKDLASNTLNEFSLHDTHRVSVGQDAVEIVPVGLDKGHAVRHFMDTPAFKGRIPIFIGDSSSDAKGMIVCAEEYGGFGIAVGYALPDAPYIKFRTKDINDTWAWLRRAAAALP